MVYTDEEREFIFNNRKLKRDEILKLFNMKFPKHQLTYNALSKYMKDHIMKSKNSRIDAPLYDVRKDGKCYIIKIAQPNVWMRYHRWIYQETHPEEATDPLTSQDAIIFLDGNKENLAPSNLFRTTHGIVGMVNKLLGGFTTDPEINKIRIAQMRLYKSQLDAGEKLGTVQVYVNKDGYKVRTSRELKNYNQKIYYEKIKKDPLKYEAFKEAKRKQQKKARENRTPEEKKQITAKIKNKRQTMTQEQREKFNEYHRKYLREWRKKKRELQEQKSNEQN